MSAVMIQIRNVPQRVHRTLKARAALAGKSLSDYILEELEAMADVPSQQEMRARLASADPFAMNASSAGAIRAERDSA